MKHPSWIKNYEYNFEQLAEEIGDLRYDALANFLKLLSLKIEKDSFKDRERGRSKLASSLHSSSESLLKSSKKIDLAWKISEPYM